MKCSTRVMAGCIVESRRTALPSRKNMERRRLQTLLLLKFGKKTRCYKSWSPLNLATSLMPTRRDFISEDFLDQGHFSKTRANWRKKAMERITLLLCTNMNGDEEFPIFRIRRSQQTSC